MVTTLDTKTYPKRLALRDGTSVLIRPLEAEDKTRLLNFFLRVPEEDRHYLKENVTAPEVIHNWTAHIDIERVIPIVALAGGEIIADATLHRSRAPARRHVGEIRLVVDPALRDKGLGSRMLREMIDIATDIGLHKVVMELVDRREQAAILAAKSIGFTEVCALQEAVKDYYGALQDLVTLELPLKQRDFWWRF